MNAPSTRPLLIFGTGELADLAHFYFTHDSERSVAGFTVDARYVTMPEHRGLPLVAYEGIEGQFPPADCDLFVAIGYTSLNTARRERCAAARARGYSLASYVSSRASVWPDLKLGDNCLIMEGNVIQPFVTLGDGVIMFCNSVVSHHAQLGDYCFISSEATICGGVSIGARSFIGANSTIREHLRVGDDCIVGAGSLILKETAAGSSYLASATPDSGLPSRRLRSML